MTPTAPTTPGSFHHRRTLALVALGSYAAAVVALAAEPPVPVRAPITVWAAIGVPALVIASGLRFDSLLERVVAGVAGAVAASMLAAQTLLYLHLWSPGALLVLMAWATCAALVLPASTPSERPVGVENHPG